MTNEAAKLVTRLNQYSDCTEYISWQGKKCYRTYGTIEWYCLVCEEYGLTAKQVDDFLFEAQGNGFTLEWVEHDVILAID